MQRRSRLTVRTGIAAQQDAAVFGHNGPGNHLVPNLMFRLYIM